MIACSLNYKKKLLKRSFSRSENLKQNAIHMKKKARQPRHQRLPIFALAIPLIEAELSFS
jgi:hypothetical protein